MVKPRHRLPRTGAVACVANSGHSGGQRVQHRFPVVAVSEVGNNSVIDSVRRVTFLDLNNKRLFAF